MSVTGGGDARRPPRLRYGLAAGLADQATTSAGGLLLVLVAGRALGPEGLGAVTIGMAAALVAIGLNRGLVLEPFAVQRGRDEGTSDRAALTASLAAGVAASAVLLAVGASVEAAPGAALRAFALGVVPALVVDAGRSIGFRGGRTTLGLSGQVAWLAVMAVLLLVRSDHSVATVSSCWAAGAAAGAAVVLARARVLPLGAGAVWGWWRHTWTLGRWLTAQTVVTSVGLQGAQLAVGVVAGTAALGVVRAAQTLFAPLTLLLPAVNIPALPVVARTLGTSFEAGRSLAARLTLFVAALCGAYLALVVTVRTPLVELVFGAGFDVPLTVVAPVALEQVLVAASVGAFLLLKAAGDGRSVLMATVAGASVYLVGAAVLGALYGAAGAAWGLAAGGATATAVGCWRARAVGKDAAGGPVRVRLAPTR